MTFAEEFDLHIKAAGGAQRLADDIETEWANPVKRKGCYAVPHNAYSDEDTEYLRELIKSTSLKLGRTEKSIIQKLWRLFF